MLNYVRIIAISMFLVVFGVGCAAAIRPCQLDPQTLQQVATIRSLPFDSPVECQLARPSAARNFIRESLNEDRLRVKLEGEVLKLLGVIGSQENYHALLLETYASRVSGYYDRKRKALFLASDSSPLAKQAVENHELVHALQDQHYDLEQLLSDSLTSDTKLARQALMEGDANLVSFLLAGGGLANGDGSSAAADVCRRFTAESLPLLFELRKGSISLQDSVALRLLMDFPYLYGVAFACATTGGKDFSLLDPFFRNPPVSTKQIVDRQRTTESSAEESVPLSALCPGVLATVETGLLRDSFGYFFLIGLLAEEFPVSTAYRVAKEFVCDELTYEHGAIYWQIHWSSEAAAADFAAAYREWWSARLRDRHMRSSQALTVTLSGATAEIRSGQLRR